LLKETATFTFVTVILQRYMKSVLEHPFQKLNKVKGLEYFQHSIQSAHQPISTPTKHTPKNQHTR
jgi:hypothetical protein